MAKWAEIKCERCAEQDALWEGMERALEESDAREATLNDRITMLEEHLCLTEEKLAQQDDLVQAAVAAALTEAAEAVEDYCSDAPDLAGHGHSVGIRDAILALIRKGGK